MRVFVFAGILLLALAAIGQPATADIKCTHDCALAMGSCQLPCSAGQKECRKACPRPDFKCRHRCNVTYRTCVKPCLAESRLCMNACARK